MQSNNGTFIASLKALTEISLYFAVTGFLAALLGSQSSVLPSVCVIALCSILSTALRRFKVLWALPLILAAGAFYIEYLVGGFSFNLVWVFPSYVYSIVFNAKKLYYTDRLVALKSSSLIPALAWIVPFCAVFGSALSNANGNDNGSVLFAMVFLVAGFLLLRYARHKRVSVDTAYFKSINVTAVIFLFSLSGALMAVGLLLWSGFTAFLRFLGSLGKPLDVIPIELPSPTPILPDVTHDPRLRTPAPTPLPDGQSPANLYVLGLILVGMAVAAILIYIIFKIRKAHNYTETAQNEDGERLTVQKKKNRRRERLRAYSNRAAVRRCFRRFMKLCLDNKIVIDSSMTAGEIKKAAVETGFSPEECDALIRIYSLARYSDAEVTDEDAKAAGELLALIKKKGGKN